MVARKSTGQGRWLAPPTRNRHTARNGKADLCGGAGPLDDRGGDAIRRRNDTQDQGLDLKFGLGPSPMLTLPPFKVNSDTRPSRLSSGAWYGRLDAATLVLSLAGSNLIAVPLNLIGAHSHRWSDAASLVCIH
jgi:hypothetical protein